MTNVNGILVLELRHALGHVAGVSFHVVALIRLSLTAMPTAIMSDHPVTVSEKEHHLRVPIVSRERPAMMEEERLA